MTTDYPRRAGYLAGPLLLLALLGLAGCQGQVSGTAGKAPVAMKVNGQTITATELAIKSGSHEASASQGVSEDLMKGMLRMELLRQAAIQAKLDQDETVRARIANATRSILATAYMEKQLASVAPPSAADVSAYYNAHPELFAQRRQFELDELMIQVDAGQEAEVRAQIEKSAQADQLVRWLQTRKIAHKRNQATVNTEQIKPDVQAQFASLPAGGKLVLGSNGRLNVVYLVNSQEQPVALAEVSTRIEKDLQLQRRNEILENAHKQLQEKAKVEYLAPYSEKGLAAGGAPE